VQVSVGANKGKQQIAAAVSQALIMATPVDTGQARGNWFASLGGPTTHPTKATSKSGSSRISANLVVFAASQPEQPIFITNNVRHIQALNDGWSKQAPAGFVEHAVIAGNVAAKRFKVFK
jgi:hypothetical protein